MTVAAGTRHHRAKLDETKVAAIRADVDASDAELARAHGVSKTSIRMVRANTTWYDPTYTPRRAQV